MQSGKPERRWTVKDKNGLCPIRLSWTRRECERRLCSEYVGDEITWSYGYRRRFEEDLERYLSDNGAEIVEVAMMLTEVGN